MYDKLRVSCKTSTDGKQLTGSTTTFTGKEEPLFIVVGELL